MPPSPTLLLCLPTSWPMPYAPPHASCHIVRRLLITISISKCALIFYFYALTISPPPRADWGAVAGAGGGVVGGDTSSAISITLPSQWHSLKPSGQHRSQVIAPAMFIVPLPVSLSLSLFLSHLVWWGRYPAGLLDFCIVKIRMPIPIDCMHKGGGKEEGQHGL